MLGIGFFGTSFALGALQNSSSNSKSRAKSKRKVKTVEVDFDDLLIRGKYHFSDESVLTVEQEKTLNGLLKMRRNYKDRLQKTAAWY